MTYNYSIVVHNRNHSNTNYDKVNTFMTAGFGLTQELPLALYILQRGVQWKEGVVICMVLYSILLYNTTPIHCNPDPLHPPLQSVQALRPALRESRRKIYYFTILILLLFCYSTIILFHYFTILVLGSTCTP